MTACVRCACTEEVKTAAKAKKGIVGCKKRFIFQGREGGTAGVEGVWLTFLGWMVGVVRGFC